MVNIAAQLQYQNHLSGLNPVTEQNQERVASAWHVLHDVPDPEIPVVSVVDLGLIRSIGVEAGQVMDVIFSPTYCGCPATEAIMQAARQALEDAGLGPVSIRLMLAPAWTTDWITPAGRKKMQLAGIVPPAASSGVNEAPIRWMGHQHVTPSLICPHCQSNDTTRLSSFGATACKALYRCLSCGEPFEYFKPL